MADLYQLVSEHLERAYTNTMETVANMSMEKWIRLVVIVGAYLLLRPYLLKLGGRIQMRQHEKEAAEAEAEAANKAQVSPNQLRGVAEIPGDTDDEDGPDGAPVQASASDWGKKARQRQRRVVKKILEVEERRLREEQEDEEDKDIQQYLIG